MGESGRTRGEGETTRCAHCARCWRASDGRGLRSGEREGARAKREKDVKRVVEQGGKALLVHGALPRKPLFVLHPFARARQAARENEGTRKGEVERGTVTEIERPKGRPTEKKDEARVREREASWSHELVGEGTNEKERRRDRERERSERWVCWWMGARETAM